MRKFKQEAEPDDGVQWASSERLCHQEQRHKQEAEPDYGVQWASSEKLNNN